MKRHTYEVRVDWTGNDGEGTKTYRSYRRDHTIASEGKPQIQAQAILAFVAIEPATIRKSFWSPAFPPVTCSGICICVRQIK